VLTGNAGNNVLDGGAGSDTASYANATAGVNVSLDFAGAQDTGFGIDTLVGIERLTGSAYDDTLIGDATSNVLDGGGGLDLLIGGLGNDSYYVDSLGDVIVEEAAEGTDQVYARSSYRLGDNVENLTLQGTANTSAVGNALANVLAGNSGNNLLDGGAGTDTASYAAATSAVNANLTTRLATGQGSDTLISIENLLGSSYADTLVGSSGANRLDGGNGKDTLSGGAGQDSFRFATAPNAASNLDTITDFAPVDDTIQLENAVYTQLTATGTLAAANFVANLGGTAVDANDYIVYETDTGKLYYDADGSAAGAAVQIALLANLPLLTYADFVVT
jgi:Ca2+-binding RTX toxin-like protein